MNIESVLARAFETYKQLNTPLLSTVYDQTGAIMMRAMQSYMKNGFTREEAFEILKVQVPDFKVTLQ
jgi:hypothetical protein